MDELSTTDVSAGGAAEASSDAAAPSPAQSENASGGNAATSQAATDSPSSDDVQTNLSNDATQSTQTDILAGLPTVDELKQQAQQGVKHAEALANIRGAYESLKPQYEDLSQRLSPWQPVMERFGEAEKAQGLIEQFDALHAWEPDPQTGQLVPTARGFVEKLEPDTRDVLAADLLLDTVEVNGKPMARLDSVLNTLGPDYLLSALKKFDGYQDIDQRISNAPSQATPEDVTDEYKEAFNSLHPSTKAAWDSIPADEKQWMLEREQRILDSDAKEQTRVQAEQLQKQQQEQAVEKAAVTAGDQFVDTQIRESLSGLIQGIVGDLETKNLTGDPAVNKGVGVMVGLVTAALAHKDLRPLAEDLLSEIGVVDKNALGQGFDTSLNEFVENAYRTGYLKHKNQNPGTLEHRANASRQKALVHAQGVATQLVNLLSKSFSLQAERVNSTLDGSERGRPVPSGQGLNPATSNQMTSSGQPFSRDSVSRYIRS